VSENRFAWNRKLFSRETVTPKVALHIFVFVRKRGKCERKLFRLEAKKASEIGAPYSSVNIFLANLLKQSRE
jgi:hypothetical protein